jgi:hypothetical protein
MWAGCFLANLGRIAPRDREAVFEVIAAKRLRREALAQGGRATKQSVLSLLGKMDCFAEPVIGRRFAPTRWLAMTI